MLQAYRTHVAERAAQGIVPLPLSAAQTADLIELLKAPPAGEEATLVELITHRVPAGVDDAAKVKASYLAAVAHGSEKCPLVSREKATELLGTMLGGYNIAPLIDLLDDKTVGAAAAEALKKTLLMFDAFHDVRAKADAGSANAKAVLQSWADAEWFTSRPEVPASITVSIFKVNGETNTDDLSPAPDAWSRPDIPLHALAMLKNARPGITPEVSVLQPGDEPGGTGGRAHQLPLRMQLREALALGKQRRIGLAQLHLHVGVDHAGSHRFDSRAVGQCRLLQRHRAGEVVHAGLGGTVRRAASHGAPPQSGRDVEHLARGSPLARGLQEGRTEQQGRLQPHAQGIRQLGQRHRAEGCRRAHHAGVVDQRGPGHRGRVDVVQPRPQGLGHGAGFGQIDRPLRERHADLVGDGLQAGMPMPCHGQQRMARLQQLLGQRSAHAARSAGDDPEMSGQREWSSSAESMFAAPGRGRPGRRAGAYAQRRAASDMQTPTMAP